MTGRCGRYADGRNAGDAVAAQEMPECWNDVPSETLTASDLYMPLLGIYEWMKFDWYMPVFGMYELMKLDSYMPLVSPTCICP